MTFRVDVGDIHAAIALVCGGAVVVFTSGCLVGALDDNSRILPAVIGGGIAVAFWCGLFALVLRGTVVTRVAAALGLVFSGFAVGLASCAAAIHW